MCQTCAQPYTFTIPFYFLQQNEKTFYLLINLLREFTVTAQGHPVKSVAELGFEYWSGTCLCVTQILK